MNKLFWVLVVLCFIGAAALWWLLGVVDHQEAGNYLKEKAKTEQKENTTTSDVQDKVPPPSKENSKHYLELYTEPQGASVYIDEEFRGRSPLKIDLEDKSSSLSIKLEGFEDYKRDIPPVSDVEGDLIWKFQLRELNEEEASKQSEELAQKESTEKEVDKKDTDKKEAKPVEAKKEAPTINKAPPVVKAPAPTPKEEKSEEEATELKIRFRRGSFNEHFIQIKSIALDDFKSMAAKEENDWFQSQYTPFACRVDLGSKGRWVRILLGPFENQLLARAALINNKNEIPADAFVSGAQKCL